MLEELGGRTGQGGGGRDRTGGKEQEKRNEGKWGRGNGIHRRGIREHQGNGPKGREAEVGRQEKSRNERRRIEVSGWRRDQGKEGLGKDRKDGTDDRT